MGVLDFIVSLLSAPRYEPWGEVHVLLEFLVVRVEVSDEVEGRFAGTCVPKIVFHSVIWVRHVELGQQLHTIKRVVLLALFNRLDYTVTA